MFHLCEARPDLNVAHFFCGWKSTGKKIAGVEGG